MHDDDKLKKTKTVLWNQFSSTGKIGAYLLYKAVSHVSDEGKAEE